MADTYCAFCRAFVVPDEPQEKVDGAIVHAYCAPAREDEIADYHKGRGPHPDTVRRVTKALEFEFTSTTKLDLPDDLVERMARAALDVLFP